MKYIESSSWTTL